VPQGPRRPVQQIRRLQPGKASVDEVATDVDGVTTRALFLDALDTLVSIAAPSG
jgi:hypothetical protein